MLLQDQGGGPNRILHEFTFEFAKAYLGAKDVYVYLATLIENQTAG